MSEFSLIIDMETVVRLGLSCISSLVPLEHEIEIWGGLLLIIHRYSTRIPWLDEE